jgi:L-lactate dehydrogenase complex protein LldE
MPEAHGAPSPTTRRLRARRFPASSESTVSGIKERHVADPQSALSGAPPESAGQNPPEAPGGVARPRVALFVTCLVDLFRPAVGFAAIRLLEAAGCDVEVPETQTCCGQPAFNTGDRVTSAAIGRQILDAFEGYDHVVVPSGSCAGMLARHLPELFEGDPPTRRRAEALAGRCHELVSFLVDIRGVEASRAVSGAG